MSLETDHATLSEIWRGLVGLSNLQRPITKVDVTLAGREVKAGFSVPARLEIGAVWTQLQVVC